MRVLMVDGSDRGGIALYTDSVVGWLRDAGVDVALAAPAPRGDTFRLPATKWGDEVASMSRWAIRLLRLREMPTRAAAVVRAARRHRPDVIHVQMPVAQQLEPVLVRALRRIAPVVVTAHNPVAHEPGRGDAETDRWRHTDGVIVHGGAAVGIVAESAPGVPVHVVPVDLLREPTGHGRQSMRDALGLDAAPTVLALGLVRPYKGYDLLADAWPAVRDAVPDARLVVVGSAPEPFADLDRLVGLPGVDARFGWVDDGDIDRWAAAADVVVLPYRHGTHSGVLHRAVANATPVLTAPGLGDEVERLHAGAVVDMTAPAWSSALVGALTDGLDRPSPPPPGATAAGTLAAYEAALDHRYGRSS